MVPVFFWLGITPGRPLNMSIVTHFGPQASKHRSIARLTCPRPALQTIIYSGQSAHAGILAVPEERAMPVVAYSLASSQHPPCAALVLLFFRLISATQLVLVLIFFQEPIGSRKLITDVTHLLFSNMLSS